MKCYSSKALAFLALSPAWRLVAGETGPSIIFIPSSPSASFPPHHPPANGAPPCPHSGGHDRRLEPFRRDIRDKCSIDQARFCSPFKKSEFFSVSSKSGGMDFILPMSFIPEKKNPNFPSYGNELDWLLGSKSSKDVTDTVDFIDAMVNDMMGVSMKLFDAALMTFVEEEAKGDVDSAEGAAESALDFMVASLFQNALQETVENGEDREATDEDSPSIEELTERLADVGEGMLLNTRRRLSEGEHDPRAPVKERLARRLTEYHSDMFLYPDGTITMYTRSTPSAEEIARRESIPILGLGSHEMDECIYTKYEDNFLQQGCMKAVKEYIEASNNPFSFKAKHGRFETTAKIVKNDTPQPAPDRIITFSKQVEDNRTTYTANISLESLLLAFSICSVVSCVTYCTGFVDCWNLFLSAMIFFNTVCLGYWTLMITIPLVFILDWIYEEDEEEENEEEGESDKVKEVTGDYVMLEDGDVKKGDSLVFVGVPVQIV